MNDGSTVKVSNTTELLVVTVSCGGPSERGSYPFGSPCDEFTGCAFARLRPSHEREIGWLQYEANTLRGMNPGSRSAGDS
jgi:hypothetical protein